MTTLELEHLNTLETVLRGRLQDLREEMVNWEEALEVIQAKRGQLEADRQRVRGKP